MVCFLFEITYYLLFIVKQTKQFYMSAFKIFRQRVRIPFTWKLWSQSSKLLAGIQMNTCDFTGI